MQTDPLSEWPTGKRAGKAEFYTRQAVSDMFDAAFVTVTHSPNGVELASQIGS